MNIELTELLKTILNEIYPLGRYLRKGKVIKAYPSGDKYLCDIEILLNDNTQDIAEPIINGVEIPTFWAGANRGIICPPTVNALCDVEYYNGDKNYPRISNFRQSGTLPKAQLNELIIQQSENTFILIKADGSYEIKGNNITIDITGDATIKVAGNVDIECSNAKVKADSTLIECNDINLGATGGEAIVLESHPCFFTGAPHKTKVTKKVKAH